MLRIRNRLLAALVEPVNIALLALALVTQAGGEAFFHIDLWPVALVAVVAEGLWLLGAPLSPAYLGLLRRRAVAAERRAQEDEIRRLLSALTPELIRRYQGAWRVHQDILAAASETGAVASELLAEELEKLEALLSAFLRLLQTSLRYRQYLNRTDDGAIIKDIAHLRGKLERTDDPDTCRIIQQNLDILEKRKERVVAIQRGYLNVQAQLEVIEDTFHLVNDQLVSLRAPNNFRIDLAQIINGVETTEEVLHETNALIAEHS